MAWADAESEVRAFIEHTQLPFLRSGKGIMPDVQPAVGARPCHYAGRVRTMTVPARKSCSVRRRRLKSATSKISEQVMPIVM